MHKSIEQEKWSCVVVNIRVDIHNIYFLSLRIRLNTLVFWFYPIVDYHKVYCKIAKDFTDFEGLTNFSYDILRLFCFNRFLWKRASIATVRWSYYFFIGCKNFILPKRVHKKWKTRIWNGIFLSDNWFSLNNTSFLYEPAHELTVIPIEGGCNNFEFVRKIIFKKVSDSDSDFLV